MRYMLIALLLLAGCAVTGSLLGSSPESQIVNGANSVTAAATLASTLLRNDKINVAQAKSYSGILHTVSGHLDVANGSLLKCRASTGSTSKTSPDPCAASVADDISLALSLTADIQKTLKAKE